MDEETATVFFCSWFWKFKQKKIQFAWTLNVDFQGLAAGKHSNAVCMLISKITTLHSSSLVKQFEGTVTTIHTSLNHASVPAQKVISFV